MNENKEIQCDLSIKWLRVLFYIAITSRQKTHNRKNYYMEENRAAMGWLKKYRMKGMNKSIGRV